MVHAGAGGTGEPARSRRRAARSLLETVGAAERVRVLVELMAGTRGAVASTIAEAAALLEDTDDDRLGLCLDICHLFAAGYGLDTHEGVAALFDELAAHELTGRVCLVHANDSAFPRGNAATATPPSARGRSGRRDGVHCWHDRRRPTGRSCWRPWRRGVARGAIALLRSLAPPDVARGAPVQGSSSALGPSW